LGQTQNNTKTSSGGRKGMNGIRDDTYNTSNGKFIERESDQQKMIMRQQDQQLDQVAETVGHLKEVAITIDQELTDQQM